MSESETHTPEFESVLYEVRDGVAVITVNRPKKLNALNAPTISELMEAFFIARDDDAVGAVVLTGAGEKAFVAGADIGELAGQTPIDGRRVARRGQMVFELIENLGKATVAAINGYALGGGLELAMAATMRVAAKGARVGLPESTLGLIPGYGGTQRLPRLVGRGRALQMILTGEPIDADEAYRIGLVNEVFAPAELLDGAIALAKKTTRVGPLAVRYGIEAVSRGSETSLEEGLRIEADLFAILCASEDMREGTTAFLEKRKAEFKGK